MDQPVCGWKVVEGLQSAAALVAEDQLRMVLMSMSPRLTDICKKKE